MQAWPIETNIAVRPLHTAGSFSGTFVKPTFDLLQASRQLYLEAAAFVYTLNTFGFNDFGTLDCWIIKHALNGSAWSLQLMCYTYVQLYCNGHR
jgi:hypothetical protein